MNKAMIGKGIATGTLPAMISANLIMKHSKKPIGTPGSTTHILTNDKFDIHEKGHVKGEIIKENIKNTAKITGIAVGTAGIAAATTNFSKKAAELFQNSISKAGNLLSQVSIKGKDLKTILTNTKAYNKINALPLPAKAAIAASTAVLTLGGIIASKNAGKKAAYIEGQHEAK